MDFDSTNFVSIVRKVRVNQVIVENSNYFALLESLV